jgi:hypothetical protein
LVTVPLYDPYPAEIDLLFSKILLLEAADKVEDIILAILLA